MKAFDHHGVVKDAAKLPAFVDCLKMSNAPYALLGKPEIGAYDPKKPSPEMEGSLDSYVETSTGCVRQGLPGEAREARQGQDLRRRAHAEPEPGQRAVGRRVERVDRPHRRRRGEVRRGARGRVDPVAGLSGGYARRRAAVFACSRSRASPTKRASASPAIQRRPRRAATTAVVPEPTNGSTTSCAGALDAQDQRLDQRLGLLRRVRGLLGHAVADHRHLDHVARLRAERVRLPAIAPHAARRTARSPPARAPDSFVVWPLYGTRTASTSMRVVVAAQVEDRLVRAAPVAPEVRLVAVVPDEPAAAAEAPRAPRLDVGEDLARTRRRRPSRAARARARPRRASASHQST